MLSGPDEPSPIQYATALKEKDTKKEKTKRSLPSFSEFLSSSFVRFVAGNKYLVISIAVISEGKLNRSLGVGLFVAAAVVLMSAFVTTSATSLTLSVFATTVGSLVIKGGLVGLGAFGGTVKNIQM